MDTCWNRIGIRGDGSCPELGQYIHCRNCPVHAAAAVALLELAPPDEYRAAWTDQFARPQPAAGGASHSVVIFRVEAEWLALPPSVVGEITALGPIHSLPHRRPDVVLGVTNIRGELTACVSLGRILGLEASAAPLLPTPGGGRARFLVIRRNGLRVVCPVQDVHGTHRFDEGDLTSLPATLSKAPTSYSRSLLSWKGRSVGLLDDERLSAVVRRSLA